MIDTIDPDEQEIEEFGTNMDALENEKEDFRLWYNGYFYLYKDTDRDYEELFYEELSRRLQRIKELEFKTDFHYYKTMMAIMTPDFIQDFWD
jgi:hypothetical protein